MPYGRRRIAKRRRTTYRKRTLSRKNIRKRTSAKSQSRQIATLTRAVSKINRTQHETIRTVWQRNKLPVETVATPGYPYMCPIPRNAMDFNDKFDPGSGVTTKWTDTLSVASQPFFTKDQVFGCSDAALNTGHLTHTGGTLKYQLSCEDDGMTKATIALIQPKAWCADQKTIDNNLRARTTPPYGPDANAGTGAPLILGTDYVVHSGEGSADAGDTFFGVTFNKKYWSVLHQRECTFGHIGASGTQNNISSANTNPANNAFVKTGTIKIPGMGEIRSSANAREMEQTPVVQNACELGLYDERNEKALFFVVISNGVTIDNDGLYLGLLGMDYYRAVV